MSYDLSKLWRSMQASAPTAPDKVTELQNSFRANRTAAETLTNEISRHLPQFTVHDIGHIDALWFVADEIIGDCLKFNPLETYVLGNCFLIHDAGMALAAYPEGRKAIKKDPYWRRLYAQSQSEDFADETVREDELLMRFLRDKHAEKAETLPTQEWRRSAKDRWSLIQDDRLRQDLGWLIGQIAASHHWPHDRLEDAFSQIRPSLVGFPAEWKINPLKIACVLRCADAANIDASRAPGFLYALRRGELNDESNTHWLFQNRLERVTAEHDALVFTSTRPFQRHEAAAWWLAYDTMKMVDGELRRCDDLLARSSDNKLRLAAQRVRDVEQPRAMVKQVRVEGWEPVDTSFAINDVPKLIEKLGGAQLYGDDKFVPVRELIMNGMDAVRMRRKVRGDLGEIGPTPEESTDRGLVRLGIKEIDGKLHLIVEDNGIGMTGEGMVENLLSFGDSGWLRDPLIGQRMPDIPEDDDVSGQYGIGFYSVFMLGKGVTVTSRRCDKGDDDTYQLSFSNGLDERPILTPGGQDVLSEGMQTRVEVVLETSFLMTDFDPEEITWAQFLSARFPTSDVVLATDLFGDVFQVDGRFWASEPAALFLARVYPWAEFADESGLLDMVCSNVVDGEGRFFGRFANELLLSTLKLVEFGDRPAGFLPAGIATYKGAHVGFLSHNFLGVMRAVPRRAARDRSSVVASEEVLRNWLTNYTKGAAELLIEKKRTTGSAAGAIAYALLCLDEKVDERLVIAQVDGGELTMLDLRRYLNENSQVILNDDWLPSEEMLPGVIVPPSGHSEGLLAGELNTGEFPAALTYRPHAVTSLCAQLLELDLGEYDARSIKNRKRKLPPIYTTAATRMPRNDAWLLSRGMTEEDFIEANYHPEGYDPADEK